MKKKLISLFLVVCILVSLTACGEKGEDVTGKYICVGESYFDGALQDPSSESWVELKGGGKGTYYSGFEFNMKWKLDGENFKGTITFIGLEETMEGTLKDGVLDVKYGDMSLRFVKEGVQAPAADSSTPSDTAAVSTAGINDDVVVADSLIEAFAGAGSEAGGTDAEYVDETLSGVWYGWVRSSDPWGDGQPDSLFDAFAKVGTDSGSGRPYFEVYLTDTGSDASFVSMWLTEDPEDKILIPDIGDEDAWINQVYLDESEAAYFTTSIAYDGSLSFMPYEFVAADGQSGCTIDMFFRKYGAYWDEANDTLPPYYDDYKAELD